MENVHGESGAWKKLRSMCPDGIEKFEDIENTRKTLTGDLDSKKGVFKENLPHLKIKEREKLKSHDIERDKKEKEWNKRIQSTRDSIKANKKLITNKHKIHYIFVLFGNYVKLVKNKYSKSSVLGKIDNEITNQKGYIDELEANPDSVFERENNVIISKINELSKLKQENMNDYLGAEGEFIVLKELEKLGNKFHVFCDVDVHLDKPIPHRATREHITRKQLDFIVVGNTGIFVIEVKNWSSNTVKEQRYNENPIEQVSKQGLLLWKKLNDSVSFEPYVKNILVSIQGNISPNPDYPRVKVKTPSSIRSYIEHTNKDLLDEEVDETVSILKRHLNN